MRLWKFLSGKKTFISSLVGVLYLLGVVHNVVPYNQDFVNAIQGGLSVGLIHKFFKLLADS